MNLSPVEASLTWSWRIDGFSQLAAPAGWSARCNLNLDGSERSPRSVAFVVRMAIVVLHAIRTTTRASPV